jgi:hypothetical protein
MAPPDAGRGEGDPPRPPAHEPHAPLPLPRYGRYAGLLAILVLVLITINTVVTKPNGGGGFAPGQHLAPFAVPLATGNLKGDANVSTVGRAPACTVRGPQVLNICQQYEAAPVVLALFVDSGSCPGVLSDMQALMPSFPGVRFAAVSIKGDRGALRRLVRRRRLTLPVGLDDQGDLAALYKVASCPQLTFALPGGVAQGRALLRQVPRAQLRARVAELVRAARAQGWRGP